MQIETNTTPVIIILGLEICEICLVRVTKCYNLFGLGKRSTTSHPE